MEIPNYLHVDCAGYATCHISLVETFYELVIKSFSVNFAKTICSEKVVKCHFGEIALLIVLM